MKLSENPDYFPEHQKLSAILLSFSEANKGNLAGNKFKNLADKAEVLESQCDELEKQKHTIVLPKITHKMADYLSPELITFDGKGNYQWTQLAVDAAAFFEIRIGNHEK